jgi:hypothetical protein
MGNRLISFGSAYIGMAEPKGTLDLLFNPKITWVSWPLTVFMADDNLIRILYPFSSILLLKPDIVRIHRQTGVFTRGIRILHRGLQSPPYILFCPLLVRNVLQRLGMRNYPVFY